ncbi:MAG: nucleotide exchange factor GrpE [Candidatus Aminicenantes bacterium]|nr:nucleotide exchange factor GrpE [Candidatus Aminicenantes bacterium]
MTEHRKDKEKEKEEVKSDEKDKTQDDPKSPYEEAEQEEVEYLNQEREEEGQGLSVKVKPREEDDKDKIIEKLRRELKSREEEREQLRTAVEELKDKFLRNLAEVDNLRKRLEKEKEDYYQFALTEFMKEMLPILDNFERALKIADESDGKTLKEGVELIYRMLLKLLNKYGVTQIDVSDRKFDPNFHHALSSEESDEVEDVEIVEELQKGYLISNRLLRPTMVRVKVPKKKSE